MNNDENKAVLLELANRIKAIRQRKKLTQAICYEDTGINFGRIERGVRDISFTTLLRICKYFEISVNELLGEYFDKYK